MRPLHKFILAMAVVYLGSIGLQLLSLLIVFREMVYKTKRAVQDPFSIIFNETDRQKCASNKKTTYGEKLDKDPNYGNNRPVYTTKDMDDAMYANQTYTGGDGYNNDYGNGYNSDHDNGYNNEYNKTNTKYVPRRSYSDFYDT